MFQAHLKKGRFINDNGFVIDFRFLVNSGYYFRFDNALSNQIKHYLRDFKSPYVLEHWNKPEGRCALWDSESNRYVTPDLPQLKQPFSAKESYRVEIPYNENSPKPSYVLFYPNTQLIELDSLLFDIASVKEDN